MLKLYVFSHPDFNGISVIAVIAYDEDSARWMASDYDNGFDIDPRGLILENVKNLNKGVVIYEYE
jgi:hypothetical protein